MKTPKFYSEMMIVMIVCLSIILLPAVMMSQKSPGNGQIIPKASLKKTKGKGKEEKCFLHDSVFKKLTMLKRACRPSLCGGTGGTKLGRVSAFQFNRK